ncbi:MAG: signal peptide peptidase SppA [Candidatus Uhrbacteria bacterium]|nr:signal peptide peptidase SppA [Candidatus Uhrbacteria bacterium]
MFIEKFKQFVARIHFKRLNPTKWKWHDPEEIIKNILILAIFLFILLVGSILVENYWVPSNDRIFSSLLKDAKKQSKKHDCTVAGIELHGSLFAYIPPTDIGEKGETTKDEVASQDILQSISAAEKNDEIKAIVLEIDSTGGSPVAGEEISIALKKAKKPTVVYIRDIGASAAYLAATGADRIFASKYSDVGSIGVTASYLDNVGQNSKDGLVYNSLSVGKFKDSGDPDKKLTPEEKILFMRDINIMYNYFIKSVSENRGLDIEKVKKIADGSTMLGQAALESGLIDQIGGIYDVMDYLKGKIGDVSICW